VTLAQAAASVGRTVVCTPSSRLVRGVITSVNEAFAFVRFTGMVLAVAVRPDDLELEEPEVRP
jgi:hypothetical protein